jgi:predicted amidohydrolase YtcJ
MRPELILYNGNIITVDDEQPHAQAVAVAHGRFIAIRH